MALITGTDFITVPCTNFEASAAFYRDVLGLQESKRWGQMPAGEFETGNLTIAIMQSDAFGLEFKPHTHPIELRGVEFRGDVIDSGVCHQTFFTDPDGNALAIHHRYAP
jgi:catechol 2,3-dioxygenase-like lactoylglutathione lyase family enzyme